MPVITLREILDDAADRGYAVPAFNVNSFEQVEAVVTAAASSNAAAIIQVTRVSRAWFHDSMLMHAIEGAMELHPEVPVCLHLDHGGTPSECASAMGLGFTSVMMDGSLLADARTPSSFHHNVRVTRKVAIAAHAIGVSVEGALGLTGSLRSCMGEPEDGHGAPGVVARDLLLTDPDQALELVNQTGVDALAIAIGNTHGAHKFVHAPDDADLTLDLIQEIHAKIPDVHLVLHGCSSLPSHLQQIIADHGGEPPGAWGMPLAEIRKAIGYGVRKINIDTDGRLAVTGAVRRILDERAAEYDPRVYLSAAREAMVSLCIERFEVFGAAGRASAMKPQSLNTMAARYAGKNTRRLQ